MDQHKTKRAWVTLAPLSAFSLHVIYGTSRRPMTAFLDCKYIVTTVVPTEHLNCI